MDKRFWAIIIVIVAVFVGIFALHGKGNAPSSNTKPTTHLEGKGATGVTLVEYGDYECPICENYYPAVKALQAKYNAQIYLQFRNLPLSQIHPNAFSAARAAEAADLQGKFWAMHDQLYDANNWSTWSTSSDPTPYYKQYAQAIGLNLTRFQSDIDSDTVNNRINADIAAFTSTANDKQNKGYKLQEATPTFFLDGKYLDNSKLAVFDNNNQLNVAATVANFSKFIDAEIAAKTAK